jgi:hypothetical protein
MAKRSQLRVSGGPEGRSERPATGHGQPRDRIHDKHRVLRFCLGNLRFLVLRSANGFTTNIASCDFVLETSGFWCCARHPAERSFRSAREGAGRALRAGVADKRSPEGEARSAPSEWRPGGPQRTSGDGARTAPGRHRAASRDLPAPGQPVSRGRAGRSACRARSPRRPRSPTRTGCSSGPDRGRSSGIRAAAPNPRAFPSSPRRGSSAG